MSCRTRVVGLTRTCTRARAVAPGPPLLARRASPSGFPLARRPREETTAGCCASSSFMSTRQYSTSEAPQKPSKRKPKELRPKRAIDTQYFIILELDPNSNQDDLPPEVRAEGALFLPKVWLRDVCQCPKCVSPSSGQKKFATCDLFWDTKAKAIKVKASSRALRVHWHTVVNAPSPSRKALAAEHRSLYPFKDLVSMYLASRHDAGLAPKDEEGPEAEDAEPPPRPEDDEPPPRPKADLPKRILWDRKKFEKGLKSRNVEYSEWMEGGAAFSKAIRTLASYGLVVVKNVPESDDSVQQVAERIGPVMDTFYGRTWDVVSKPDAENVAYTNDFLCLHQDLLYHDPVPKIQLLHCLKNECEGGDSLFSDGLRATWDARAAVPNYIYDLRRHEQPFWYTKNGNDRYRTHPIAEMTEAPRLMLNVNWSPPFQAPLAIDPLLEHGPQAQSRYNPPGIVRFAKRMASARSFRDSLEHPDNMWQYKMEPGDCVIFDNRRILHGRTQFKVSQGGQGQEQKQGQEQEEQRQPQRHLRGCYLDEATYEAVRARHAGAADIRSLTFREHYLVWRSEQQQTHEMFRSKNGMRRIMARVTRDAPRKAWDTDIYERRLVMD